MLYNCYNYPYFKLKAGDLIFFKPKSFLQSDFISAIADSSPADKAFYHVSMVINVESQEIKLIEATPKSGVILTKHNNLCKTHGFFSDIEVYRVGLADEEITKAVDNSLKLVGLEYNDLFSSNYTNSKGNFSFYCSQLIQYVFNSIKKENIFPNIPMSFKDSTGEISEYWKNYYETRNTVPPQDEPGSHPSSIYESKFLICLK